MEDYTQALTDYGEALADGVEEAMPAWVRTSVTRIVAAWAGGSWAGALDRETAAATDAAGEAAAAEVGAALRALVRADVDAQRSTPLTIVRGAVRWPTGVLRAVGVPPVERGEFEASVFPDDDYGLTPASLADLDPRLGELAIAWGAAKAWVHKRRHSGA
ncbi:hypothetical protein K6U06_21275 [Acidiferrimicrobium sp. IK]|uniref:hypothetical protein n=1 Tax=Acidiferrimicrobium sp. IK TaxID=2871700 RepID=UPI0021CB8465|nr:hypothetical protein [Acidiferrimicrobium sp. IK]MCU4186911.1 hypothetical protein [Acidiferrimicrobium sp. IK]